MTKRDELDTRGFRAAWPDDRDFWVFEKFLFEMLWKRLGPFVNGPWPMSDEWMSEFVGRQRTRPLEHWRPIDPFERGRLGDAWTHCREGLKRITQGRAPASSTRDAPLSLRLIRKDPLDPNSVALDWAVNTPLSDAQALGREFWFTVMLAWHPRIKTRLRLCSNCEKTFFFGQRNRTGLAYCSSRCRSRHQVATRSKAKHAQDMRTLRATRRHLKKRGRAKSAS